MLDSVGLKVRLSKATELVDRHLQCILVAEKITQKVEGQLSKSQKEFLLRQQMRAIKEELGDNDDDEDDVAALERKMQSVGMPPNIWKHAHRELRGCRLPNSAYEIYEKLYESKLHNGNDIPTLAACISIACQYHDSARTKMEICAVVDGLELHHLSKAEARIKRFLANDEYCGVSSSSKPAALINRFGSLLRFDFSTKRRVKEAVLRCEQENTSHKPETMVASVMYLINKRSNGKPLLQKIALVTGVNEGTIKKAAKRFENVI